MRVNFPERSDEAKSRLDDLESSRSHAVRCLRPPRGTRDFDAVAAEGDPR
jgi:hypothetical protein